MRVVVALYVACSLLVACGGVALAQDRAHVLLIGVDQYANFGAPSSRWDKRLSLPPLQYCVRDMEGLRDALIRAKFCNPEDVTLLTTGGAEPTAEAVTEALNSICSRAKGSDRILIAFAGHGVAIVREGVTKDRDDYLCCSDAILRYGEMEKSFTMRQGVISRTQLEERLASADATTRLFFVDACRNTLATKAVSDGIGGMSGFGAGVESARVTVRNGLFRFAACMADENSQEYGGDIQHGVFSHFLIKGLGGEADSNKNGIIALDELVHYTQKETQSFVATNISTTKRQTPVLLSVPRDLPTLSMSVEVGYCEPPQTPQPEPPQPTPPQPELTPPEPEPVQQPTPTPPKPEPVQQPTPAPPKPEPVQQPTPTPPKPEPVPQPTPTPPKPEPVPQPTPAPPQPEPVQQPTPTPPQPEPVPQPTPTPPQPEPVPQPTPAPPKPEPAVKLPTPQNVRVTGKSVSSLIIVWDSVANASDYTVEVATTADFRSPVQSQPVSGSSYTASRIRAGTTYHVRVRANGDGKKFTTSEYSAAISATTDRSAQNNQEPRPIRINPSGGGNGGHGPGGIR